MKYKESEDRQEKHLPNIYAIWRTDEDDLPFSFEEDDDNTDGGPGSGNHGHKGRPGKRGGSAKRGSLSPQETEQIAVKQRLSKYGKNVATRRDFKDKIRDKHRNTFNEYRPVIKARKAIVDAKRSYVTLFERSEADMRRAAQEAGEGTETYQYYMQKLDELQENKKPYVKEYENAKSDLDEAVTHMKGLHEEYEKEISRMNECILTLYPNYDSIKTSEQASEYLSAKGYFQRKRDYDDLEGGVVSGEPSLLGEANIDVMTPELALVTVKTADKIYERYPELSKVMGSIRTYSYGEGHDSPLGTYGKGVIAFYDSAFQYNNIWAEGGSYHPQIISDDPLKHAASTVAHEFGHALDEYLSHKYEKYTRYVTISNGRWTQQDESVAPTILRKAAKNLGIRQPELKKKISGYACKNSIEALAEAFSEYMISDNPRPAAREIGKLVDSLYHTGTF